MFNTDYICLECSKKEKTGKDYKKAVDADIKQIKQGNYNLRYTGSSQMSTSYFIRKAVDLDEVKNVYYSNKGNTIGQKFMVKKVIELSQQDFEEFTNDLLDDYSFIKENNNLMYVDKENVRHCLLVKQRIIKMDILLIAKGTIMLGILHIVLTGMRCLNDQ